MRNQRKSGCGCGPLVFVGFAVGVLVLVFVVAPMTEKYKTLPAQPEWYQRLGQNVQQLEETAQKMLPWSHPSTTTRKSGTAKQTSTLSGSCFDMARQAAQQAGIDPTLFVKQINQESGCSNVTSPAGAQGVAQLMPFMSYALGVNPHDTQQSLQAGARLMAGYLKMFSGSWALALACYNAGSGRVKQVLASYGDAWLSHLPLETQNYVHNILG